MSEISQDVRAILLRGDKVDRLDHGTSLECTLTVSAARLPRRRTAAESIAEIVGCHREPRKTNQINHLRIVSTERLDGPRSIACVGLACR